MILEKTPRWIPSKDTPTGERKGLGICRTPTDERDVSGWPQSNRQNSQYLINTPSWNTYVVLPSGFFQVQGFFQVFDLGIHHRVPSNAKPTRHTEPDRNSHETGPQRPQKPRVRRQNRRNILQERWTSLIRPELDSSGQSPVYKVLVYKDGSMSKNKWQSTKRHAMCPTGSQNESIQSGTSTLE